MIKLIYFVNYFNATERRTNKQSKRWALYFTFSPFTLAAWPAKGCSLPTVCQGRYSKEYVTETNTKYKPETDNGGKLACSHMAKKFSPNLAYTVPSTQVLPCHHFQHNLLASSNISTEICQKQIFSHTSVLPVPTKNFSAQQSTLCVRIEVTYLWTEILFQTQTNLSQNLQSLQFTTYLSKVSWGTLLPPALLLTVAFLLAVMVISAC